MCTVVKVAQSFRVDHCLHYKLFTTVMAIVSGSERIYTFRTLLTELPTQASLVRDISQNNLQL